MVWKVRGRAVPFCFSGGVWRRDSSGTLSERDVITTPLLPSQGVAPTNSLSLGPACNTREKTRLSLSLPSGLAAGIVRGSSAQGLPGIPSIPFYSTLLPRSLSSLFLVFPTRAIAPCFLSLSKNGPEKGLKEAEGSSRQKLRWNADKIVNGLWSKNQLEYLREMDRERLHLLKRTQPLPSVTFFPPRRHNRT